MGASLRLVIAHVWPHNFRVRIRARVKVLVRGVGGGGLNFHTYMTNSKSIQGLKWGAGTWSR